MTDFDTVIITEEFLRQGGGPNGGWNAKQLQLIGAGWPPVGGWKRKVIGRLLPKADAEEFIRLGQMQAKKREAKRCSHRPCDEQPSLF